MRQKEFINTVSINHEALLTSLAKCEVTSLDRRIKALDFGCNEVLASDIRYPKSRKQGVYVSEAAGKQPRREPRHQ